MNKHTRCSQQHHTCSAMLLCRKYRCGVNIVVRTVHTALCIGVPVTLLVEDTILNRALVHLEAPLYGFCYICLLLFSLAMYYTACLLDPGFLAASKASYAKGINNNSDEDSDIEETGNMIRSKQDGAAKYRKCDYCEIQQPMRSKHCEDCKRCVRKYDHHCPWLEVCVGERNHKFFWLFLCSITAVVAWTLYITWEAIVHESDWSHWFKSNIFFFLDMVVLVLGGFVLVGLLSFHTYLMLRGLTTWETVSRERITYLKYLDEDYNPFDEGCFKNVYYFLCSFKSRHWEALYSKKADVKSAGIV